MRNISVLLLIVCSIAISQSIKEYTNPIIAGFYPDPSICRVGSDYYLVNSTFSYFPGLNIFHSKDLVNWNLIGYVLNRQEQLNLEGQGVSRGLFAPAIRYFNGTYYVTYTLVDIGGNFVVTAKDPAGPWSNPVWIPEIDGIDPSMFFDDNGKAYIIYNSVAPENKPLYNGHRSIRMYEFDINTLKVLGTENILVNGGTVLSQKPIWIEGPHIFQKDGYYYLICAEGGTADYHSVVVFRSKSVDGPYVSYNDNPILTQRHLDTRRKNPITTAGHADFVQTENGDWWAVFLGCRPYRLMDNNTEFTNTGRETFLIPVQWKNGWPNILHGNEEVQYRYPYPIQNSNKKSLIPFSGNFTVRDEFNSDSLKLYWNFLRTPQEQWYTLRKENNSLSLRLRPEICSGNSNPSFIGRRQQHLNSSAAVKMDFTAIKENEKSGIVIFQNERHFYFLCKSVQDSEPVVQLYKYDDSSKYSMKLIATHSIPLEYSKESIYLKISSTDDTYSFFYSFTADVWTPLKEGVDATFLSTRTAGGFVGCFYAMYASSHNITSTAIAEYDWFEYKGNDQIYDVK